MWPEAESNCRPLVFQTEANHLSFLHFNLFVVNYCSFIRGSKTQLAVNNRDFFCECVPILSHFRCSHHHIFTDEKRFIQLLDAERGLLYQLCKSYKAKNVISHNEILHIRKIYQHLCNAKWGL